MMRKPIDSNRSVLCLSLSHSLPLSLSRPTMRCVPMTKRTRIRVLSSEYSVHCQTKSSGERTRWKTADWTRTECDHYQLHTHIRVTAVSPKTSRVPCLMCIPEERGREGRILIVCSPWKQMECLSVPLVITVLTSPRYCTIQTEDQGGCHEYAFSSMIIGMTETPWHTTWYQGNSRIHGHEGKKLPSFPKEWRHSVYD